MEVNYEGVEVYCKFNSILKVRIGSHCHGTNVTGSDEDIRNIVIPSLDYFFGLKKFEVKDYIYKIDGNDVEYWDIIKLVELLIKGNPSAMNILFVNKKDILYNDEIGLELLNFKENFLSKKIIDACVGYTVSQIHKVEIGRGTKEGNRTEIINKFGYDVKFMSHAYLMTCIAIELIKTNTYHALRPPEEQNFIKSMRVGQVPLEEARKRIESNLKTIKMIESVCKLPEQVDEEKVNKFITELLGKYFIVFSSGLK